MSTPLATFYPESYGAVRDGVHDDSSALNAAGAAASAAGPGGTVTLSAGVYAIASTFQLYPNVRYIGAGQWRGSGTMGGTVVRATAGMGYVVSFLQNSASNASLEDMTIDGNAQATGYLIVMCSVTAALGQKLVRVSAVNGLTSGVLCQDPATEQLIDDCYFDNIGDIAVSFQPSTHDTPNAHKVTYNAIVRNVRVSRRRGGFGIWGALADCVRVDNPCIRGVGQRSGGGVTVSITSGGVATISSGTWDPDIIAGMNLIVAPPGTDFTVKTVNSTTQLQLENHDGSPYSGGVQTAVAFAVGSFESISLGCCSNWLITNPDTDGGIDGGIVVGLGATVATATYNGNSENIVVVGGSIRNVGNTGVLFASDDRPAGQTNIVRSCEAIGTIVENCNLNGALNNTGNDSCFHASGADTYYCKFTGVIAKDTQAVATSQYPIAFDATYPQSNGNTFSDLTQLGTVYQNARNADHAAPALNSQIYLQDSAGDIAALTALTLTIPGSGASQLSQYALQIANVQLERGTGAPSGTTISPVIYIRTDTFGTAGATHLYTNPGGGSSTWTGIA